MYKECLRQHYGHVPQLERQGAGKRIGMHGLPNWYAWPAQLVCMPCPIGMHALPNWYAWPAQLVCMACPIGMHALPNWYACPAQLFLAARDALRLLLGMHLCFRTGILTAVKLIMQNAKPVCTTMHQVHMQHVHLVFVTQHGAMAALSL